MLALLVWVVMQSQYCEAISYFWALLSLQLMILSLLKGIGNAITHPRIAPTLSHLMEQYYDKHDNSFQKFLNTETRIMCLLLEVSVL